MVELFFGELKGDLGTIVSDEHSPSWVGQRGKADTGAAGRRRASD